MIKHKLFSLFAVLENKEVYRLRKFLHSPTHNKRPDLIRLYEFLRANAPFDTPFEERTVFEAVYPGEEFENQKLRLVISYLYQKIESFLVWEKVKENKFEQNMVLMELYRERGLTKSFAETVRNANKEVERLPQREANYFLRKYMIHEGQFMAPVERSDSAFQDNFQKLSQNLDDFFIFSKLKYACGILNHQRLFKVEYETQLLEEVVRVVEARELWRQPGIGIYYYAYKMLVDKAGDLYFERLMQLIRTRVEVLLEEGGTSVYLLAINYCIRKVNTGDVAFRQVLFDLYLEALRKGYLLTDGMLLPWSYKNIVSIGLKVNALSEVESFLETYRPLLPEDSRESFYQYGWAELNLAKGAFQAVIEGLYTVQFKDPLMALNARITLIKAYFELEELDLIEYQLDSFKHFLKRKEIVSYHRENYRLFALYCKAMIQLGPPDPLKRKGLIEKISQEKKLVGKEWLLGILTK